MYAPRSPFTVYSPYAPASSFLTVEELLSHMHSLRKDHKESYIWVDVLSRNETTRRQLWETVGPLEGIHLTEEALSELVDPCDLDVMELVSSTVSSSSCIRGAVSCAPQMTDPLNSNLPVANGSITTTTAYTYSPYSSSQANKNATNSNLPGSFSAESTSSSLTPWCSFIATRRVVVTFHEVMFAGFPEMQHSLSALNKDGTRSDSTAALVAKLVCFTSETRIADPTTLLSEVDCMDEMVLLIAPGDQDQPDLLRRVALLRRRISSDRNSLYLKEKLLHSLMAPSIRAAIMPSAQQDHYIAEETRQSLEKITQIADRLDDARDTLNQANLNFVTGVSMRMSQSSANMDFKMQIFGQVATICLPLNLVASIFGMNCKIPFESDTYDTLTPFWIILGLMGLWCIICSIPTIRSVIQGNRPMAIVPTD